MRRVIAAGVFGGPYGSPVLRRLLLPGAAADPNLPRGRNGSSITMVCGCRCRCCCAAQGVPWFDVAAGFHTRAPPGVACAKDLEYTAKFMKRHFFF